MAISPNNEKIEKYLDELADEYKTLLYKALVSRSKPLDDLSVSELLRLDNEIKKGLFEDYKRQQKSRRKLLNVGLVYMFIGAFTPILFLKSQRDFMDFIYNISFMLPAIIVIVGLCTSIYALASLTSGIYPKRNAERQEVNTEVLKYEVVAKWREVEGIVNDISLNANVNTPRSIIDFLVDNQFIDERESAILKDFLKMRNDIVHSTGKSYSKSEIKGIIDEVNKITDRLRKIM